MPLRYPFPDETFDAVICQFRSCSFPTKPRRSPRRIECFVLAEFSFQRVGSNRREPIRQYRDRRRSNRFSAGPAAFFMLAFPGYYSLARRLKGIWPRAGLLRGPNSRPWRSGVRPGLPGWWRWPIARGTPLRNEIEERDASLLGDATGHRRQGYRQAFRHGKHQRKDSGAHCEQW